MWPVENLILVFDPYDMYSIISMHACDDIFHDALQILYFTTRNVKKVCLLLKLKKCLLFVHTKRRSS